MSLDLVSFAKLMISGSHSWGSMLRKEPRHPGVGSSLPIPNHVPCCWHCFGQRWPLSQPRKSCLHLALSPSLPHCSLPVRAWVRAVLKPRSARGQAPSYGRVPGLGQPRATTVCPLLVAAAPTFVTAAVSQGLVTLPEGNTLSSRDWPAV